MEVYWQLQYDHENGRITYWPANGKPQTLEGDMALALLEVIREKTTDVGTKPAGTHGGG